VAFRPDYADVDNNLGIIFREQGDLKKARRAFERANELSPTTGMSYRALASMKRVVRGNQHYGAMERSAREVQSLPMVDQKELHFALGKP
jgi:tetratricopeptide (TPR) repeat protein